jgi:hypothetical protein
MPAILRFILVGFTLLVAAAGCCHRDCGERPGSDLFSCCDLMCYCPDWFNRHSCVNRGCYDCDDQTPK